MMTKEMMKEYMEYKGVEITVRDSGLFQLISPVNGTLRIFREIETAINYIDNAEALDSLRNASPW